MMQAKRTVSVRFEMQGNRVHSDQVTVRKKLICQVAGVMPVVTTRKVTSKNLTHPNLPLNLTHPNPVFSPMHYLDLQVRNRAIALPNPPITDYAFSGLGRSISLDSGLRRQMQIESSNLVKS
jgi:hypothetical protein